jgi:muramoyltetrapeptide carboxypeptidase
MKGGYIMTTHTMIKPSKFTKGDGVRIVSPSSGVPDIIAHRFDNGVKALEEMGCLVSIGEHAQTHVRWTSGTPEERAADINAAFADPNVKLIMCSIGGFHSNQIIDLLDYEMIRENPKIFIGYSDITVMHFALHTHADLVTFYGPTLMPQYGEPFGVIAYTQEMLERAVMQSAPIGRVTASTEWTDEFLDWVQRKDEERPRALRPNPGHKWLRPGVCEGVIMGGCLTSMQHLRGTPYWPDMQGKIFFWEIPEGDHPSQGEPLARVDSYLTDLKLAGVFDQIVGMIVGRPKNYLDEDWKMFYEIILKHVKNYDFPVLADVDIGHTDPIMTLPIGVNARLDSQNKVFEITESAVV